MKKTNHHTSTSVLVGVAAIGKFELVIFVVGRLTGEPEPLATWEFSGREVKRVIADLEECLSDEMNPGLQEAYRESIRALRNEGVLQMISDFSYPDNVN